MLYPGIQLERKKSLRLPGSKTYGLLDKCDSSHPCYVPVTAAERC